MAHCGNVKIVPPRTSLFRIKQPSIVRSIVLALAAFVASLRLGGFPDIDDLHASRWQILPVLAALVAMVETVLHAPPVDALPGWRFDPSLHRRDDHGAGGIPVLLPLNHL